MTSSNLSTARGSGHGALSFIEEEEELSGQSEGSQDTDDDELESRLGRGYVGSIASTYWRPERTDRGGLATLDERLLLPFLLIPRPGCPKMFKLHFSISTAPLMLSPFITAVHVLL